MTTIFTFNYAWIHGSCSSADSKLIKCYNHSTINNKVYHDFIYYIARISNWATATDIIDVALKTSILNLD